MGWLANELRALNLTVLPVVRLDDSAAIQAEAAAVAAAHGAGACLRLGSPDSDPDVEQARQLVPKALADIGLARTDVDLVIDMFEVGSLRQLNRAAPVAKGMVSWADQAGPWRTVTIAAGAFPNQLFSPGPPTVAHRFDADLFDQVARTSPISLDFGDYGIGHPSLPTGGGFGPTPYLRYTCGREWYVYKQGRNAAIPGNQAFFTVCSDVVNSTHWPARGAAYSAGDREIERCAQRLRGAGTATYWLEYSSSHHTAHVIDRLSTVGVP